MRTQTVQKSPLEIDADGVLVRYLPGRHANASSRLPIGLLNGIGAGNDNWGQFPDALRDSADVLLIDVLGATAVGKYISMAGYSTAVDRALEKSGVEKVDLFGISWGGALAQETALRYPDRVGKLILAATVHGWTSIPGKPAAFKGMVSGDRLSPKFQKNAGKIYGGDIREHPEFLEEIGILRQTDREAYMRQLLAIGTWQHSLLRTALIRHETLVMGGEDDPISRPLNSYLMAVAIRNSQLHIVKKHEGGGHLSTFTRPQQTARDVTTFLGYTGSA